MKKLFLLHLLLVAVWTSGNAQIVQTDTLVVLQIAQEEGLSQLGASSLQFDDQGYLWVGTQNGLNRFNSYEMKVWLADIESSQLPDDDHIRAMHYKNDTLWMTTNTYSLCAYLLAEDRFINFADQLDFDKNPLLKYSYALYAAPNNTLIIGTAGHCILFDKNTQTFDVIPVPQILGNDFVTCVISLEDEKYLIGTNASGLFILDAQVKEISTASYLADLQHTQVNTLYKYDNGDILIGSDKGLYRMDPVINQLDRKSSSTVRSIQKWDDQHFLIGGKNQNFLLTNDGTWHNLVFVDQNNREIASDVLVSQEDMQGGRWLGTETRGVFYYHPYQKKFTSQRIQAENSPKKDFISTFNFLRDGSDLWLATEFGFVKHRLQTHEYKLYRTDLLEYTLAVDHRGTIWGGGFEQGLLRYDRDEDRFSSIPLSFIDKDIIQITPVSYDTIWVHTWSSGIYALHTGTLQSEPVTLLGKNFVRSRTSLVDSRDNIWIGSDEGVFQINQQREVIFYDSLSNERVFAIAEGSKGNIWVGTAQGLNRLDPSTGKITQYTRQAGLPNDFIYGVEVDKKGNIWVSTNYGISVLDHHTQTFKNYTEDDGLQNNEFNGKAAYQDSLGYLYFGGMNGFNIFHPDSIRNNQHPGKTHIESVLLFGRPTAQNILYTDTLVFSHNQNVITFDFVNLNYLWSKKNRYQFMLVGFDKEWRPITSDRSTTYTNLAPGVYRFKVRGSNNELLWGEPDEITVIIRSPWYATTAFRVGLALLVTLLICGGFVYKTYQQRKTNRRLSRMVDLRTQELSETNKALHKSLKLTQRQKENISFLMQELNHRVKNNLQLITSLIDIQSLEINDARVQDRLRVLQSRVFTVSKIHDLLNTCEGEKGGPVKGFINSLAQDLIVFSGKRIAFQSAIAHTILPSHKLTYLGLVLNELITNSIKHAFQPHEPSQKIQISLEIDQDEVILQYQDNGVGFNKDDVLDASHQGINLIHLLIKELKGTIEIETETGAVFIIRLPKNQQ